MVIGHDADITLRERDGYSALCNHLPDGQGNIGYDVSVRFKRGQLTREIEKIIQELDAAIKTEHEVVRRIFVEAEPA